MKDLIGAHDELSAESAVRLDHLSRTSRRLRPRQHVEVRCGALDESVEVDRPHARAAARKLPESVVRGVRLTVQDSAKPAVQLGATKSQVQHERLGCQSFNDRNALTIR